MNQRQRLAGGIAAGLSRLAAARAFWPLLVAGMLRLAWIALIPNELTSDQLVYHQGASAIAAGDGFVFANGDPIAFWPVGYSGLLAAFYWCFGSHVLVAHLVNALLGVALTGLCLVLGRDLYDRSTGMLAAFAVAVYPTFVLNAGALAAENLYNPMLVAFVWFTVRGFRSRDWAWSTLAGILAGLTVLVRPTALVAPAIVVVAGLAAGRSVPSIALRTAFVCALLFLVCVPWGLRNERTFGEFKISAYNGGPVLWMGNHPGSRGVSEDIPEEFTRLEGWPERDRAMRAAAVQFILANPGEFVRLVFVRTYHTLRAETIAVVWNEPGITNRLGTGAILPMKLLCTGAYYTVALAFLWNWVALTRERAWSGPDLVLAAAVLFASVPFLVVLGQDRYHLPLVPFAIIGSAQLVTRSCHSAARSPRS